MSDKTKFTIRLKGDAGEVVFESSHVFCHSETRRDYMEQAIAGYKAIAAAKEG